MAERDWAKDLAKIDKQIERMPEQAPAPEKGARSSGADAAPPASAAGGRASAAARPAGAGAPGRGMSAFGAYARLALSVVLGIAMMVWPYESRCGWGLSAYLAAVIVVVVSGGWSALWTWRHRAARAHVLSLLILLWGLVLGSVEILPRIGYAVPDARHPASWVCRTPQRP